MVSMEKAQSCFGWLETCSVSPCELDLGPAARSQRQSDFYSIQEVFECQAAVGKGEIRIMGDVQAPT